MTTYKGLNVDELLAELEIYRWRDKKAVILKELKFGTYLSKWRREEIREAYGINRLFALIDLLDLNKEADDLIDKGYRVDEIIRAVMEWVKEHLDEIEKENK